jgi:hypothetical protein
MRNVLEFRKLLRPLVSFASGRYAVAAKSIVDRRIEGDYSIIAALLYAVSNHHLGNSGVTMAFYNDIYEKVNRRIFFNEDSNEYIKAFIERYAFEAPQERSFDNRKVNYFLRRFFPISPISQRRDSN